MKFIRFSHNGEVKMGSLVDESTVRPLSVAAGSDIPLTEVELLTPTTPSKIVCVGLNYRCHATEMGHPIPDEPIIFLKPSTAVIAHKQTIVSPTCSRRVDYEAELAIVIGKDCRDVPKAKAHEFIFGYTCLNDVTARDLQAKDGQWTRAKSFDTFCPFGPFIETDLDPNNIGVRSFLNGELKQSGHTSNFIFDVATLVNFISGVMTLKTGDVIATGTPSGIGPMKPGDEIVIEIDGIGRLVNQVA